MDINKEMYIWINTIFRKDIKEGIVIDGNSFDDELGFGMAKRSYEGEFIQLSKDETVKNFGEISMIHFSRFGLKWIVKANGFTLRLPFLLTSNLAMNHIYSGKIHITFTHRAKAKLKKYPDVDFAVISENCIANLMTCGKYAYMDVFTDKLNFKFTDLSKEQFCFEGFNDCIGEINI